VEAVATRAGLSPVLVGGAIVSQRKRVVKKSVFSAASICQNGAIWIEYVGILFVNCRSARAEDWTSQQKE